MLPSFVGLITLLILSLPIVSGHVIKLLEKLIEGCQEKDPAIRLNAVEALGLKKCRKKDIEIIEKYSQELELQDRCYLPGSFWKSALEEIKKCFLVNGISSFRKEEVNLSFFVPTYGSPGNGFSFADLDRIYKT